MLLRNILRLPGSERFYCTLVIFMSTRGASKRGAPEIDRNNIKRTREAEDDEDKQDEMEDVEDFEEMFNEDDVPSSLPILHIKDDASFPNDWKRKESTAVCLREDFTFQQIEIDVSSGKPHETMVRGSDPNDTPHIRLFGLTKEGHSVLTHVHGFMPYLYSECPPVAITQQVHITNSLRIFRYFIDISFTHKSNILKPTHNISQLTCGNNQCYHMVCHNRLKNQCHSLLRISQLLLGR